MTRGACISSVLVCLTIATTTEARRIAETTKQVNEEQPAAFLKDLQHAVDERNVTQLASLLHYPTIVLLRGYTIPIENPQALPGLYKVAFTSEIRCVIDGSHLPRRGQQGPNAQLTPDGLVLGRGAVRVVMQNGRLGIVRMVVPPTTSPDSGTRPLRRIHLSGNTTQLSGLLERDDTDVYLFSARTGQRLFARIALLRSSSYLLSQCHAPMSTWQVGRTDAIPCCCHGTGRGARRGENDSVCTNTKGAT